MVTLLGLEGEASHFLLKGVTFPFEWISVGQHQLHWNREIVSERGYRSCMVHDIINTV